MGVSVRGAQAKRKNEVWRKPKREDVSKGGRDDKDENEKQVVLEKTGNKNEQKSAGLREAALTPPL